MKDAPGQLQLSEGLLAELAGAGMEAWARRLPADIEARMDPARYGNLPRWRAAVAGLPELRPSTIGLDCDAVRIGSAGDADDEARARLREGLMALHPWRKGPFSLFGLMLDAEWRSSLKWNRIAPALQVAGERVLDVGCGNGYYALRLLGQGAARVVGIDPTPLFVMQFQALRRWLPAELPVDVLPLALEDLPEDLGGFDTVLSMGVLYHRRSPLDHLLALRGCLRRGGRLLLETLVVEGDADTCLFPPGRYAKMRNTWFLPSVPMLERWLQRCGFGEVERVDTSITTTEEQRRTEWMQFESLADFLDPEDPARTIEGHPAPRRAVLVARAP
ncbi:MAG: tRNA 5-methoxyuridine(34)/uridine 5-oxyacetic acid(34) synthase CmoB [Gammaproteobacteria bacterium]|nr:MAG: tRNA 5-methoxyuridine(34)/uridine 5-oxyacetic acid(34) synthase CmoB [Gammaproteobacteria bacterium]